jgi:hypothetical protein
MILLEIVSGMGRGSIKKNGGANSCMINLIYCKNFCKCHNVLPPSTTIKKMKKRNQILKTSC